MTASGDLAERLVAFMGLLRYRGLTIGVGEGLDLSRAVEQVGLLGREDFRSACRVTLVKRAEDLAAFEESFEEYWGGGMHGKGIPVATSPVVPRGEAGPSTTPWSIPTTAMHPGGEPEAGGLWAQRYSPDAPAARGRFPPPGREDLRALGRLARRFRRWAANLEGRRWTPDSRGLHDFPRTIRRSLGHGGEVVVWRTRRRVRSRARLLVLWDVSGSMEGHGPHFLGQVHALARAVPATRVFAFASELEEITCRIRGAPYPVALARVAEVLPRVRGGTRIGHCLGDLARCHRGAVDGNTTVLVFSDGWDLGDLRLLEDQLAALRRRCHRLVWVNPYAGARGFSPDAAGMHAALPYIDHLVPPQALAHRSAFVAWFGPFTRAARPSAPGRPRVALNPSGG